ncbi:MAG: response regulator transcription factor [Candidatus Methylomirabilales bacterium]
MAVVDGNAGARQALVRQLGQVHGVSVVGEAEDPEEALRMVRDQRPQVVVMDVRRMEPKGPEFVGRLVADAPGLAVVILTAYLTERERYDLVGAGARAILLKEIDSGALVRTIRTVAAPTWG